MRCPGARKASSDRALLFAAQRTSWTNGLTFSWFRRTRCAGMKACTPWVATRPQRAKESCGARSTSSVFRADNVTPSKRTPCSEGGQGRKQVETHALQQLSALDVVGQ